MTSIITIMTDFGLRDGFVAVMKGVILGLAPDVHLVDVTHLISPQNVREAGAVLSRSAFYFPAGTIHIFVVDPGVGTARRPIAAQIGHQRFVGPDNGALTMVLARAKRGAWPVEIFKLDQPRYWRPEISNIFHGRDIFAPVAAHLAKGVPLAALGSPIIDPVLLPLSPSEHTPHGLRGEIIHVDHFGNIATNIRADDLADLGEVTVRVRNAEMHGLVRTFGDRAPGELIALINSVGELAVAVVNGNAGQRLEARVGDVVEVVRAASSTA
jgi:S-adenosylmethionine hydrolase